jgi:ArsR family transcriptional regulator, arsenate/arsenite/antimonite-responsive transcriptional repressor
MGDDEVCVCFFVEILKMPQPKVSRHLAYLRRAGIVAARREGKWMHYRIVPPSDEHAVRILHEVREYLARCSRTARVSSKSAARLRFRRRYKERRSPQVYWPHWLARFGVKN